MRQRLAWLIVIACAAASCAGCAGSGSQTGVGPAVKGEDAHDRLVYARYSRTLWPSSIKIGPRMRLPDLDHPATLADVAAGKAVFSFQGLGPSRAPKLPASPMFAVWPALKDYPFKNEAGENDYDSTGFVCQAEELQVDGRWKRYFGFACKHGVAVLPADQVELFYDSSDRGLNWMKLPSGIDWGMSFPRGTRDLKPGQAMPVSVGIRNRTGDIRYVPTQYYRDAAAGGPALREGISLRCERAPFKRTVEQYYPAYADYAPLEPIGSKAFAPTVASRILESGESFAAFEFDLHDWFKIDKEGYYQFRFEFDAAKMGLRASGGADSTAIMSFTIGTPPPVLSVEEFNADVPPLGGEGAEERLKNLIHDSFKAAATRPAGAQPATMPALSKSVNGLAAGIDYVGGGVGSDMAVLLRLVNTSKQIMIVPIGNGADPKQKQPLQLQIQTASGAWKDADWQRLFGTSGSGEGTTQPAHDSPAPTAALEPGQTRVILLWAAQNQDLKSARNIKVVLRQNASIAPGEWSGELETPPAAAHASDHDRDKMSGTLPFPDSYPELVGVAEGTMPFGNGPPDESGFSMSWTRNVDLLAALRLYQPAGVRREFERRMVAGHSAAMQMLLASVAAEAGGEWAAMIMVEAMKSTDYATARSVQGALQRLLSDYEKDPPDWVVALACAALADERYATGMEHTMMRGNHVTISHLADEDCNLTWGLGYAKAVNAVPSLIEMVKRTKGARGPIMALGLIGDERAIPVIMDVARSKAGELHMGMGGLSPEGFERAVGALGNLKAKQAVPFLIEHLVHPEVIEALEAIGDPAAVPALKKLIAVGKAAPIKDGGAGNDAACVVAAKIALVALEGGDKVAKYTELYGDKSLGQYDRRTVVGRLCGLRDPKAIGLLIKAVKSDESGAVVNTAIEILSFFKNKAAVTGLIECFDAKFDGKDDWRRAYTPEMFRDNIAQSLRTITGESLGTDKAQWREWWNKTGKLREDLK